MSEQLPLFDAMWRSQRQIAAMVNVRTSAVNKRAKKLNFPQNYPDHFTTIAFPTSNGVYETMFYDFYGVFNIVSKMHTPRAHEVFHALLSVVCAIIEQRPSLDNDLINALHVMERMPDPKDGHEGFVYLLQNEEGICKIGITVNLVQRQYQLEREHGALELLAFIETDDRYKLERELHHKYAHRHHHLEWFALSDDDIEEIKLLQGVPLPAPKQGKQLALPKGK